MIISHILDEGSTNISDKFQSLTEKILKRVSQTFFLIKDDKLS